ncbi:pucI [Symbiodinium sp. CCMP2456]|nr:pucI [Symbiodinium sp. CCMP2456]
MGANSSCCRDEQRLPGEMICAESSKMGVPTQATLTGNPENPSDSPESATEQLARRHQSDDCKDGPSGLQAVRADSSGPDEDHVGWIKMKSLTQLEVDEDIFRSVSLRQTLRGFGRLWRKSPLDLPEEARKALWEQSHHAAELDVFLSHTWRTSGRWKVFALLLQSGWMFLLLSWMGFLVVSVALYWAEVLPRPFTSPSFLRVLGVPVTCHVGPFLMPIYLPAMFVGVLCAAYSPQVCSTQCFLDVVCIHQVDEKLMLRGIYSLGGFLARSKELRVLWSPPYFSRKWCVFEMAAYRAANPTGRIRLVPLFLEVTILALWTSLYFTTWLMYVAGGIQSPLNATFPFPIAPIALLPMLVAAHTLRRFIAEKQTLVEGLANFDVDKSECRLDFDSQFVNTAIEAWYGSRDAFNRYVRGALRKELVAQATHVPVAYFLLFSTIPMIPGVEITVGMWLDGLPYDFIWARILAWLIGFGVGSQLVSLRLLFYLCDRFASPRMGSCACDYIQTLLIFLAYMICDLASYTLCTRALQHSLWASAIYCGVMICLAGFCHRRSLAQRLS